MPRAGPILTAEGLEESFVEDIIMAMVGASLSTDLDMVPNMTFAHPLGIYPVETGWITLVKKVKMR